MAHAAADEGSARRVVRVSGGDSGVVSRRVAGETVIVPVSGRVGDLESIYTLNDVGSRIWQLIEQPASVAAIVDAIAEEYQVERGEAERDVLTFLHELESKGLVRSA